MILPLVTASRVFVTSALAGGLSRVYSNDWCGTWPQLGVRSSGLCPVAFHSTRDKVMRAQGLCAPPPGYATALRRAR
eukprot:2916275-Prymnesium_polylepis.1